MGGLHGNWAFILALYALLLLVAIAAHVAWLLRILLAIWRSNRPRPAMLGLILLVAALPVVSYYATLGMQGLRRSAPPATTRAGAVMMPALGLGSVVVCASLANLRYAQAFRGWSIILGFIPGFLALYIAMQAIIFMAASVFGLSRHGILTTRTHLISAAIMLAVGLGQH